jgi:hypothetical protein
MRTENTIWMFDRTDNQDVPSHGGDPPLAKWSYPQIVKCAECHPAD